MSSTIRSTQRAPRSCKSCSRRKVKCDKTIPCQPCVSRGEASSCKREVVQVRGAVLIAGAKTNHASYDELVQENKRLQALVSKQSASSGGSTTSTSPSVTSCRLGRAEEAERRLFEEIGRQSIPRTVFTMETVVMPSKEFSDLVIEFGFQWTFWIHYALFIPTFRKQHNEFWRRLTDGDSVEKEDPLWLSVYFSVLASSLLFMSDQDTRQYRANGMAFENLVRNWYESALYFLDKADFMAKQGIQVVQIIAILGVVCNNVGDVHRHQNLWAVALRQAEELRLGDDPYHEQKESYREQQIRRRLWWTLVLCDWLPVPYRFPSIADVDFSCALPDPIDDDELEQQAPPSRLARSKPRAIIYHITLSKVARIYYWLRYQLRVCVWTPEQVAHLVFTADDQLANLISELPPYLQFDETPTEATANRDAQFVFISWQKNTLTRTLLYYRIAMSRLLPPICGGDATLGARTRAICLSSALGLINSVANETVDASKFRPWHIAMTIFSACATLALELSDMNEDFGAQIDQGVTFLYSIRSQNMIAENCIRILESVIGGLNR